MDPFLTALQQELAEALTPEEIAELQRQIEAATRGTARAVPPMVRRTQAP